MSAKPNKPRPLIKGCGRDKFQQAFNKPIEEFSSYKRATEGLNERTKKSYRRILPFYFLYLNEDPDTVITNRKNDLASDDDLMLERYERKTKAYIRSIEAANLSIGATLSRIHGFYTNNSRRLSLDMGNFKFTKARKKRKYSPSNDEVRKLIGFADSARDKFIIAASYHHGALPIDLAKLRVGDYPFDAWTYAEKSRSKTGEVWRVVSTPDCCDYLRAYMQIRKGAVGEPLLMGRKGPLDNVAICEIITDLINRAGLNSIPGFSPKCFRDGFEDALVDSNANSKIKESLMARTSDVEHFYGGFKQMVTHLTEAMQKVYPFICLNDVLKNPAELAGFSAEDVTEMKKLLGHTKEITRMLELVGRGELVHIDDPELPKRLRDKGLL